jgi:hypothetical protein
LASGAGGPDPESQQAWATVKGVSGAKRLVRIDDASRRQIFKRAYYGQYGRDPEFRQAWAAFRALLAREWAACEPLLAGIVEYDFKLGDDWLSEPGGYFEQMASRAEGAEATRGLAAGYRALEDLRALLEGFRLRWVLPRDGVADLWTSWRIDSDDLRAGIWRGTYPTLTGATGRLGATIVPPTFKPFRYDPVRMSRETLKRQVDRMCRLLRAEVDQQACALEAQAERQGWTKLPTRQRNAADLLERAERVYLRKVKGMSWGDLAQAAGIKKGSVVEQVGRWGALLGLPEDEPPDGA